MALSAAGLRTSILNTVEGAEPRLRPYVTTLTNAPGASGTTLSVPDGDAWQVGDIVEGAGGEQALVTAISTNDLTVTRNYRGAENLTSGEVIRKNPRFTIEQIDQAVDEVLQELSPRVWQLASETLVVTVDDWYDVTDTAMEEVFSVWFIEDGDFRIPLYKFSTDLVNDQPKIFIGAYSYTGNVYINYRKPYAAITDLPDRLGPMMVAGAVYKLLGGAAVTATSDQGRRTDRTVQGGQEGRDSYWYFREYVRLRDTEVAYLVDKVARLPKDRISRRASRYRV